MPADKSKRPLSPHLQVYRLPMTALMSIAHRITGAGLAVGSVLVIVMLLAASTSEGAYNNVMDFMTSIIGQLMLFGWTFAMFYHMCNGIRHLIWDTGRLFKLENAQKAGWVVLGATVFLTIIVWVM